MRFNWDDNGHQVQLSHQGSSVTATYVKPYVCDHRDGTGQKSDTTMDFTATLDCDQLVGQTSLCRYGKGNSPGITTTDMQLTVNEDGTQLSGSWKGAQGGGSITLKRIG